jgi:hypothetical protein
MSMMMAGVTLAPGPAGPPAGPALVRREPRRHSLAVLLVLAFKFSTRPPGAAAAAAGVYCFFALVSCGFPKFMIMMAQWPKFRAAARRRVTGTVTVRVGVTVVLL